MLNTSEIVLVHHSRCGMLAFTDGLLQAGFKGVPARGSAVSWRDRIHRLTIARGAISGVVDYQRVLILERRPSQ